MREGRERGSRTRPGARVRTVALTVGAGVALLMGSTQGSAQGPGSTGAQLLTLTAGARAAAFAGAYTAMPGDIDGVFYNPAAAAWLDRGVGIGYEEYVQDVVFGSLAGGVSAAGLGLFAGIVYLDAGEIEEVVPDPAFGGERGRPTGATVGAVEAAARFAVATPVGERASAGAAFGVVTSDLAGVQRRGVFVDVGAQYRVGRLALGAALRNVGPALMGGEAGDAPLPLEGRLGATYQRPLGRRIGAVVSSDVVVAVEEETVGVALGGEVGLLPDGAGLSAVLRAGATLGPEDHLGRIRVGGGIGVRGIYFDYTLQRYEYFGSIHRVGLRWMP